jgi:plasmid stability protein
MSVMIQVRNVPDDIHRKLKARAAMAGVSLSDFLLQELRKTAELPTMAEVLLRIGSRKPVATRRPLAAMVRDERDSR